MKILITGANGQLGLELQKQLQQMNEAQVIATDYQDLDITDLNRVRSKFLLDKPDVVINCAAHTAVDKCEDDIENAYKINAIGPKNLAMACDETGAKLVQVSTDYVFDGQNKNPRREDDITNPQSIYGSSKLVGEENVKTFCKKYFIIRTAWLYGEGNNFVRTMLKLSENHDEINVVGDQFGSPTSTKDLAAAIIELIDTEYYGTYHGTCEGQCSWYDFTCKIFELRDIKVKVNKVTSQEYAKNITKKTAPRPKYSVLDNFMLKLYGMNHFRNWEEALIDYLNGEA